ncbi:MAG TPA: hypothetical protein VFO33_08925 [Casimicrobiaceae bacterium]|nr:hypothetical protein [Casimicrobiaceae bacterium]
MIRYVTLRASETRSASSSKAACCAGVSSSRRSAFASPAAALWLGSQNWANSGAKDCMKRLDLEIDGTYTCHCQSKRYANH